MTPTVQIDASKALARFSQAGIPEAVRSNLRRMLPSLGKAVGASVEAKLDSKLKSRRSLTVRKEMVENPTAIYARINVMSSRNPLLPLWLEEGTKAHPIVARNAPALAFFWERMGRMMIVKSVMHPGTPAFGFMAETRAEMGPSIVSAITEAVRDGLRPQ